MPSIGEFIKIKREAAGYTQEKLAAECGLKYRTTLYKIENGKRNVSLDELKTISKILGNFTMIEALKSSGYAEAADNVPMMIQRLDALNEEELSEVDRFIDFLIFKRTTNQ